MMRRIASVVLLLALAGECSAAVRTSTQTGNWSSTSTWGGSAAPGDGDQAVIAAGHTVTVDANTTVGKSPPRTPDGDTSLRPGFSTSAGSGVTSLPTGSYTVVYTNVDSSGVESHRSCDRTVALTNGSSQPRITLPSLPTGVTSRRIYLTDTNGSDTEAARLYATGVTGTTYDPTSASWMDGTDTYANATALPKGSAIEVASTGKCVVGQNVTLRIKGDVRLNGAEFEMTDGADVIFDASDSAATTNTFYYVFTATGVGTNANGKFVVNGTSGNRCSVTSDAGGGNVRFTGTALDSFVMNTPHGQTDAEYCDFSKIGASGSTARAWELAGTSGSPVAKFYDCTFDECGTINVDGWSAGGQVELVDCIFTDSVDSSRGCLYVLRTAMSGGGTMLITGNSFDRKIYASVIDGATVTGNYFADFIDFGSSKNVTFEGNLYCISAVQSVGGDAVDNYFMHTATSSNNNHFLECPSGHSPWLVDGNIFQHEGNATLGDTGDVIFAPMSVATTVTHNLLIPSPTGAIGPGVILMVTASKTSLGDIYVDHNTIFACVYNCSLNEPPGATEMQPEKVRLRSNLYVLHPTFASTFSQTLQMCQTFGTLSGLSNDFLLAADYNGKAGTVMTGADITNGYHGKFTYTPGANDVSLADMDAIGFVDPARDLGKWAQTFHSTDGTTGAAKTYLAAHPDEIGDMIAWVKAGFAPSNVALQDAGHDGVTIGAVEMAAANDSGGDFFQLLGHKSTFNPFRGTAWSARY